MGSIKAASGRVTYLIDAILAATTVLAALSLDHPWVSCSVLDPANRPYRTVQSVKGHRESMTQSHGQIPGAGWILHFHGPSKNESERKTMM